MEENVLVTGGTGFIGSHLVEALVRTGRRVKCLVRNSSNTTFLEKIGVDLIPGDLMDRTSLDKAVHGVDTIYHLAAQVRPLVSLSRLSDYNRLYTSVNLDGTKNLVKACLVSGIKKFIYFSSIAAMGVGEDMTEDMPCQPVTLYGKSKKEAEDYVLSLVRREHFPAIVIRPGQIYGPRCIGMLTLFKLIKHNIFFTVGDGNNKITLCYVDDLVSATLSAEEKGVTGEIYFIGGENCTFRGFVLAIADELGVRIRRGFFPKGVFKAGVNLKERAESLLNLKWCPFRMDISSGGIKSITSSCCGSMKKATKELGYVPRTRSREGIYFAAQWYKENGLI